jgi:hypothetical protein
MKVRAIITTAALIGALLSVAPTPPASARIPRILFYGPSLTDEKPLNEAKIAQLAGYEVRVADEAKWRSLTTDDFASYDAIVVGDPNCGSDYDAGDYLAPVLETRDTWAPAVTGPAIAVGSDPMFHQRREGAVDLTRNAIDYAVSGASTGMYVSLSCYFSGVRGGTALKIFNGFGDFEVRGQGRRPFPGCPDDLRIAAGAVDHPAMEGLTHELLSNWHCSAHEGFDAYPEDWAKLVGERHSHEAVVIARPDETIT